MSEEGQERRTLVEALLAEWSTLIGPPHPLLVRRMPQLVDEWSPTELRAVFEEVAAVLAADPLTPAWEAFQELRATLRKRRRAP